MDRDIPSKGGMREILIGLREAHGPFTELRAVYFRVVGGCVPLECPMGSAGE